MMNRFINFFLFSFLFVFSLFAADIENPRLPPPQIKNLVVITGVTKGLGRAMAKEFILRGWRVAGCGRSKQSIQELNRDYGSDHFFSVVDITEESSVAEWSKKILAIGIPDLVINNAAIMNQPAPLWKVSGSEFNEVIAVNVIGTFNIIRRLAPALISKGRGLIVNISSGWGREGGAMVAPYSTSKFAIEGLTQSLAQELPPSIVVVALDPGAINTEMLRKCISDEALNYPAAEQRAKEVISYILSITAKDTGNSLTVP